MSSLFDVVWHCFCSPCCDLCAAAWLTVLYTVFVGVVFFLPTYKPGNHLHVPAYG